MAALIPSSFRTVTAPQSDARPWVNKIFPVHSKTAFLSILGVWLGYFLFAIFQTGFVQSHPLGDFFEHYLLIFCASVFATWLLYRMMIVLGTDEIFRLLMFLLTLPSLVLAFSLTQIDQWKSAKPLFFPDLFYGVSTLIGATNMLIPYLLLISWSGIYLTLVQNDEMTVAIRNSQDLQKLTRKSEQRALRYQLNPHFIFNALNSVSSLVVDSKNERAERLVDELADYMRAVLDDEGQEMVTVANELAQQKRYLDIERVRFPDRLSYEINIAQDAEEIKIPAMIIQPLVENAVKHGVAKSSTNVAIAIDALIENDRLNISVGNTGRMQVTEADAEYTGTGLSNIADRLKVIYGPTAALIVGNKGPMAVATVIIPNDAPVLRTLVQ